jgi:hypothetical protein
MGGGVQKLFEECFEGIVLDLTLRLSPEIDIHKLEVKCFGVVI